MRKTMILAVVALMGYTAVCAQERMSEADREKAIGERIEKAADRLAKELNLKEDVKKDFTATYAAYQKEMFATNQTRGRETDLRGRDNEQKELSDDEAKKKLQENFNRQEQQIETMKKRLEVQKKYADEFGKMLTPQQLLKVLTPQRGGGDREQGMQRRGNDDRRQNLNGERRGGFGGGPRGGNGGPGGGF